MNSNQSTRRAEWRRKCALSLLFCRSCYSNFTTQHILGNISDDENCIHRRTRLQETILTYCGMYRKSLAHRWCAFTRRFQPSSPGQSVVQQVLKPFRAHAPGEKHPSISAAAYLNSWLTVSGIQGYRDFCVKGFRLLGFRL